jgi:hypothetical protein
MARVEQHKIISNKETFTLSSYNGIEVIIRDKDGYVNASKMVDKLSTKKFYRIYDNGSWKEYFDEIVVARKIEGPMYELKKGYMMDLRGSYVHPLLVNYIAIWASAKYAVTVSEIMDNINIQAQLLEKDGNEYLKQTISDQNEMIKVLQSENKNLNTVIIDNEKRMVPRNTKITIN